MMIESCPKKRMVLSVTLLGMLTVLILIIESHWTTNNNNNPNNKQQSGVFPVVEQNATCWRSEKYEVVQDCQPCTDFEIKSRTIGVCVHTHYKEVLKCVQSGEIVTRSCDRTAHDRTIAFYRFEAASLVFAIISTVCAHARKTTLTRRVLQRAVQRQLLANSV